jgi:hypothetical protein
MERSSESQLGGDEHLKTLRCHTRCSAAVTNRQHPLVINCRYVIWTSSLFPLHDPIATLALVGLHRFATWVAILGGDALRWMVLRHLVLARPTSRH